MKHKTTKEIRAFKRSEIEKELIANNDRDPKLTYFEIAQKVGCGLTLVNSVRLKMTKPDQEVKA